MLSVEVRRPIKARLVHLAKKKVKVPNIDNEAAQKRWFGSGEPDWLRVYIGWVGEYALSRFLDIDWKPYMGNDPDPGYDMIVSGKRIDVKTDATPSRYGSIKVKPHKVNADIYVLVKLNRGTGQTHISGWATKEDILDRPITDPGSLKIPCYHVKHRELRNPETLKEYLG